MTEREFWQQIEWSLCKTLAATPGEHKYHWCDGFVPEQHLKENGSVCITGTVFLGPTGQEQCEFRLQIPLADGIDAPIDWAALIPAPDDRLWYDYSPEDRRLELHPRLRLSEG